MRIVPAVLALALTLGGCAAASSGGGSSRNTSVLTRDEIVEANQMDALQLVRAERPQWLFRRGARTMSGETDVVVYLDGSRLGGPESLADIATITIERMRHYSEREAQYRWGVGHLHGAIEVISRK